MKAHPIEIAAAVTLQLARYALVGIVGISIYLTGWEPPAAEPAPLAAITTPVDSPYLTVATLRKLAREAGHRKLARSGRRAELLTVLQLA